MTTHPQPRLYQDWPAYRRALRAYARWCVGLFLDMYAFPGSAAYHTLQDLRGDGARV